MHNNGGGRHQNNNNRPRHNNGGSNHNRPRKNYPQLREKYLNQARDALSAGDRVMAEYYFQHADHCYRMMAEEGYFNRRPHGAQDGAAPQADTQEGAAPAADDLAPVVEDMPVATTALPAFLTMGGAVAPAAAVPVQDWEERDAQ